MRKSQTHSPSAEASDRGPAKYFHGRKQILVKFRDTLWRSEQKKAGTTFLIQGAPGAGKTALLHKCEELARDREWDIAKIPSSVFWDPAALRSCLGLKRTLGITGGSLQISAGILAKLGVSVDTSRKTIMDTLQSGKKPLLLTLDEAQRLGMKDEFPADQIGTVRHVLNAIHNGELERPVILIAAGLGTTEDAFGTLGISRFERYCLVELGALDKDAECAVLHDWLTKDGRATGDTTAWIGAIARETHGWPQHILSYVGPALDQLYADNGLMTSDGLRAVLKEGRTGRVAYYKQRVQEFSTQQRHSFAKLFANVPRGGSLELEDIMMSLIQDHGAEKAREIFHQALHKGVLHRHDGDFAIPIPSMHDWLVSNYAREQIKFSHGTPHIPNLDDQSSSVDFCP